MHQLSSFNAIKSFFHDQENYIEFLIGSIYKMLSRVNDFDQNFLQDHVETLLLFDLFLQSLNLFIMTDTSVLDEFICSRNPVIMNLQHRRDSGDVMIKII